MFDLIAPQTSIRNGQAALRLPQFLIIQIQPSQIEDENIINQILFPLVRAQMCKHVRFSYITGF